MADADDDVRCKGTTAKGRPCRQFPMKGRDVCKAHSGDPDVGRKGLLTAETQHAITLALSTGAFAEDACRAAGISTTTYYRWMEQGELDAELAPHLPPAEWTPERAFWDASTRARANARLAAIGHLRNAMKDDWRAAAFFLERTMPNKFGRRDRLDVKDPDAPDERDERIELTELSEEDLAELERIANGG